MKKILIIDSCWDCKHNDPFHKNSRKLGMYCEELKKYTGLRYFDKNGKFIKPGLYKGCRLEDYVDQICGDCKTYDSDTLFCDKHPVYGELVEQDSCKDWSEDDTISE